LTQNSQCFNPFGPDVDMNLLHISPCNFSWNLWREFFQIWHSVVHSFDILKKKIAVDLFEGAQSRYFELFWPHTKLPFNGRKPENNSLIR